MKKLHPAVSALLADIEAYRIRAGMNKTEFGRRVMRDGNFIERLKAGRLPTVPTIERVRRYIDMRTMAAKRRR